MKNARQSPLSPPPAHPASDGLPFLKMWFRIDECAVIFSVSNNQVRNWLDDGTLESRAVASQIDARERIHRRVTRQSIVRLLNDTSRAI